MLFYLNMLLVPTAINMEIQLITNACSEFCALVCRLLACDFSCTEGLLFCSGALCQGFTACYCC